MCIRDSLETVQCFFELPEGEQDKYRVTYDGQMCIRDSYFIERLLFERFYIINDEDNIFHLNPQIRAISSSSSGHNGFSSVDKLPVSIAFRIISIEGTA